MQCLVLERFLELACRLLTVTVHLGFAYATSCVDPRGDFRAVLAASASTSASASATAPLAAPTAAADPAYVPACAADAAFGAYGGARPPPQPPFDVLIGADGPRSAVRSSLGVGYGPTSSFVSSDGSLARELPELSQVSNCHRGLLNVRRGHLRARRSWWR